VYIPKGERVGDVLRKEEKEKEKCNFKGQKCKVEGDFQVHIHGYFGEILETFILTSHEVGSGRARNMPFLFLCGPQYHVPIEAH
jgi:hypothetical protein